MFGLGFSELIIVGVVAILLFGKRLPDVARSAGKYYADFRKSLVDIQRSFNVNEFTSLDSPALPARRSSQPIEHNDREEVSSPRFEPPPASASENSPA